jgi:V/A-type H+-transporting ATPase subunit E
MTIETSLEQLENAIRKRAQNLVETHFRNAQQQRTQILAEATKRLRLREERETELAKTVAEQEYRRRVQASEIKMQAELDQLRWSLVQVVMSELREQLKTLSNRPTEYKALLKQYLANAVPFFAEAEVVVEVNAHDHALLSSQWEEMVTNLATKRCQLTVSAQHFMGGLLVRNREDRIRIDNTFEGLMERLEGELYQVITSQLFATVTPTRNV